MLFLRRSFLFSRTSEAGAEQRKVSVVGEDNVGDTDMCCMLNRLTFLPHLDVLADSNVLAPGLLDDPSVAVVLPLPHLLQQEELQRRERTVTAKTFVNYDTQNAT